MSPNVKAVGEHFFGGQGDGEGERAGIRKGHLGLS